MSFADEHGFGDKKGAKGMIAAKLFGKRKVTKKKGKKLGKPAPQFGA